MRLTLLVGAHAQAWHRRRGRSVTDSARDFAAPLTARGLFALLHPGWRTNAWQRRHPWFDAEVLPALRAHIAALPDQRP